MIDHSDRFFIISIRFQQDRSLVLLRSSVWGVSCFIPGKNEAPFREIPTYLNSSQVDSDSTLFSQSSKSSFILFSQAATKPLPKGQRTLERFFGGGAAPGKKLPTDGKLDSVKRKRSPTSREAVTLADDAPKHSVLVIEDSPPAKSKFSEIVAKLLRRCESSRVEFITEYLFAREQGKRRSEHGMTVVCRR